MRTITVKATSLTGSICFILPAEQLISQLFVSEHFLLSGSELGGNLGKCHISVFPLETVMAQR